jgi:DNA topoisomerase-1
VVSATGDLELVHTTDATGGISRHGARRFSYRWPNGRVVTDASTLHRIRALAVPPAWQDVWICPDPNGHLQATGRDLRGRKQARYHPAFRQEREALKFGQLVEFAGALPRLRRAVRRDLGIGRPTELRQTALVVHLLDATAIRIGNEEYRRTNGSFGLSTMRARQAHVDGAELTFSFIGKSGRRHQVRLHDRRIARLVRQCQELPGQALFSYLDDAGELRSIGSHHVNGYLRSVTGTDFTAKTFRTWTGTAEAAGQLARSGRQPPTKTALLAAIDHAAEVLGNTRSVCRSSYVHPAVQEAYLAGDLPGLWRAGPARPTTVMTATERRTAHVLRALDDRA